MLALGGGCVYSEMSSSSSSSHYDQVLNELRQKGERLANQYIVELYIILRDEENMPPEDCRDKIEHDCVDLWSRATIRKYLPPESKDPKKRLAGKMGGDEKEEKKKAMLLLVAQQNTGEGEGARTILAENDSDNQNKQESETFHNQLNQQLEARKPTQEIYDVSKMLDDKDSEIERLKQQTVELQVKMTKVANGIIILSTDLLVKMFSELRGARGREVKYFYLKAKDDIVTGYETDITRSNSNNRNNASIHFNQ
jgi:archaellum component FlaC